MNKTYVIKINSATATVQTVQLATGQGTPTIIKVNGHVNVELTDAATGRAPQKIAAQRVGKDLHIAFEGGDTDQSELILQDFYEESDNHLVGLAENDQFFEYIPTSGDGGFYVPSLPDGEAAIQALGGTALASAAWVPMAGSLATFAGLGLSPWMLAAVGLGAAAVAVAIGKKDDDGPSVVVPATPTTAPNGYLDNVGPVQSTNSMDPLTDDNMPGLQIGALPAGATGAVLYVDGVITPSTYDPATGTLTPNSPLPDGTHTLGYGLTNPAGTSPSSPTITVTVDATAPEAPVVKVVDSDGDGRPNISGTGEPGGKVTITDPTGTTHTTTVDPSGHFELEIDRPVTPTGEWTATVTDPAGNTSPPGHVSVTDLTAPAAPNVNGVHDNVGTVTGLVPNQGLTDDSTPTITGTAEPGSKVTILGGGKPIGTVTASVIILDRGRQIGTATVSDSGKWTFTPLVPMMDGAHVITVTAVDAADNVGKTSLPYSFTLASGGTPTAPTITNVIDDVGTISNIPRHGLTNDPTPTVEGTALAGHTVHLYREDGVSLGFTVADSHGLWSLNISALSPLSNGAHSFTATSTDLEGRVSEPTDAYQIVVDLIKPADATDPKLTDDVGGITGDILNGTTTDDATPIFTGKAEPGTTVTIKDGVKPLGTALVDASGNWTFTPTEPLVDGIHSLTATVTDLAGNVSEHPSPKIDFTVDTRGQAVSITAVTDKVEPNTGPLLQGASTNDLRPTVSGNATAGGTVKVYDETGALLGAAVANSDGHWSVTPTFDLPQGEHSLTATVTTATAPESPRSASFKLTIDSTVPAAPVILSVTDDVGSIRGEMPANKPSDDNTPTFRGTAEPDSTVTVLDGGQPLGTVKTDHLGNWIFTPVSPLKDGIHAITATSTDAAGNTSAESAPWSVQVDTKAPETAPVIVAIIDDQGSNTGNISSGTPTNDTTPTLSGTAEANSLINVFDGGVFAGSTTANAMGDRSRPHHGND